MNKLNLMVSIEDFLRDLRFFIPFSLSGVPQSSHLGPYYFLYLLMMSLLFSRVVRSCCLLMMKIFRSISTTDDALALQHVIDLFCIWCELNRSSLNIDKCHIISFHRGRVLNIIWIDNSLFAEGEWGSWLRCIEFLQSYVEEEGYDYLEMLEMEIFLRLKL